MTTFKRLNLILGWLTFVAAAIVYILTIEPTTSFWDTGEFITSAYKLQVGHPPGAPFFMLLGRIFSLLSFGDVTQVPVMINIMSALASAFTIMFLFWTVTHLARRALAGYQAPSEGQTLAVIGAGLVAAFTYTFSDTFWFSAVEGEVYALSSLFTAIVFWAILKWENQADQPNANRWIIFIAYMMGLSIGVHLLNLLTIPAIVFIYYFRKYEISTKGIIYSALLSVALLLFVMYGIIQGFVMLASKFELLFVNTFGLPFNSGAIFYLVVVIGALVYGIYHTYTHNKPVFNTVFTGIAVILIGYSSFALILIRSNADTPMNQNQPDDLFSFQSYLNREQYGTNPLVHGQYFNAQVVEYEDGKAFYKKEDGKYVVTDRKIERKFDPQYTTIFPRMYSSQTSPNHVQGYMKWTGMDDRNKKPSFADNLKFFFRYQVNHMYIRYFMWNFAGRQNDVQGHGSAMKGNWLSGIEFIDDMRLGDQDKLPEYLKSNPARNHYYFLPLILGLIGLVFQYKRDRKNFWIVLMLFFFTGLAIVLYLNQPPYQPRERDYAYAGSFYAFAIWIGFGVLYVTDWLKQVLNPRMSAMIATIVSLVLVPGILASENWDDHDRSERYTAREFAKNYLKSTQKNGILFTNGDNDTFPLWYVQEVEGFRTDVKVVNLSYLNTDWYINQMKTKTYNAQPVPFSLKQEQYQQGTRDAVYLQSRINRHVELKKVIDFIASDREETQVRQRDQFFNICPTQKFKITVDSSRVVKGGTVTPKDGHLIEKEMRWKLPKDKSYLRKNELMVLDLIATNNWERQIYYAITVGPSSYLKLQNYFQLDGMTYRLTPIKSKNDGRTMGRVDSGVLYENLMEKFNYGGISNPDVYLDENNRRMIMNLKNNFSRLAAQLIKEGEQEKAIQVLDTLTNLVPHDYVPLNYYNMFIAQNYYKVGQFEKANAMMLDLAETKAQELSYISSLSRDESQDLQRDRNRAGAVIREIQRIASSYNQQDLLNKIDERFRTYLQ